MNSKLITFVRNFSYTLTSNLISLIISALVTLIVPKLVGLQEYGYWQLYMFYASYVGFFQFGWNDGIYLRYGGKDYQELENKIFFSQFWMLVISQIIIAGIIITLAMNIVIDPGKKFIFTAVAVCLVIVGVRAMPLFILQGTGRIEEYAKITMIDRILYCCLITSFLIFGLRDFKIMVLADILGKFISLLYAMYCCRRIIIGRISSFHLNFKETSENINVGIKLMFSNIASMLIIGVVRFGTELSWDVETFGRISLTLSVSNLMMIFINAVGIIMFPILRRTNKNKLTSIYVNLRDFLMIVLLGMLIFYYPIKALLLKWLPEYAEGLIYMALVFPMCIYEGKMSLLISTYLKTLREEKAMLKINLVSLVLSVVTTIITTIIFKNLNSAILSIVFLLAFRCILSELYLSNILKISIFKDTILETLLTLVFILLGWFGNSGYTVIFYLICYLGYLFIKKKDIIRTKENFKLLLKK